jgi:hypothetical protein
MSLPTPPVDNIKAYQVGEHLRAEDVNAFIAFMKKAQHLPGFWDGDLSSYQQNPKSPPILQCKNTTGADIPKYSLFSIANSSSETSQNSPPLALIKYMSTTQLGSHMLFLTNGQHVIPDNGYCEPEIISFDKPVFIEAIVGAHPQIGEQCGPGFGATGVSSFRHGLVCVSSVITLDGVVGVWVTRTREPIKVCGCVSQKITALNQSTKRVGVGKIRVLFRDPNASESLVAVNSPSDPTQPWEMVVYNHTTTEYEINSLVSATETMGIGLTVNYELTNTNCASSNSSSSP